jgi:2,5-diketo-D-gluconate reductase A
MQPPELLLNDDCRIPQLGFGVFLVEPDQTERIVSDALEIGYRHIDTAAIYQNEEGVGRALAGSGIPRNELYITTKLWNSNQGRRSPHHAIDVSLEKLGLEHVDLYLIHWPSPVRDLFVESWLALEEIRDCGKATSIGVSNFQVHHLERILAAASTVPAVNQIELHPAFAQRPVSAFARDRGIQIEAWGPLGQGKYELLSLPSIVSAADAHGKTPAQVVLRWHLQTGNIVFPKSNSRARMAENFDVLDFELSGSQMAAIDALDAGMRVGINPDDADF